ncbi:glycoside hydrolase family 5 protein [Candidatus Roizmanbacteria bacterium]|nr:glycoside hydrolase family 5 protein [Candidatus Roizmanbacteria bacterium]
MLVFLSNGCSEEKQPISQTSQFVYTQQSKLMLDGKSYKFIGVNRYNILRDSDARGCGNVFSDADLKQWFDELHAMGANAVRFWFYRNFTDQRTHLTRFDTVLAFAKERNMKVLPVFDDHWAYCTNEPEKNDLWYQNDYKIDYKPYVLAMGQKYKDDPTILLWDLMNEPQANFNTLSRFATDMSAALKKVDPNHLISLGTLGQDQPGMQRDEWSQLLAIPTLDIGSYHDYSGQPPTVQTDGYHGLSDRLSQSYAVAKPLFVGEAGLQTGCQTTPQQQCFTRVERADLFKQKMSYYFSHGGVGYLIWSYRDYSLSIQDAFGFNPHDPLYTVVQQQAKILPS